MVTAGIGVYEAGAFLHRVSGFTNPFSEAQQAIAPAQGSIAWKLQHGQQVNLVLLGYGGSENDAPWLTDSILVVSMDPTDQRAIEVSIPRDLGVPIDAFASRPAQTMKVNAAYAVAMDDASWPGKKAQFAGADRDRGGRLAEQTLSTATGLHFDGYVAVDFKAFRDVVNALGGVEVCLDGPLDDYQYPDYHDGFVRGGIHFKAGCQQVNGEQALELARSRHAVQPQEASDFGRSRRQQLLTNAIRKKATAANAIAKAPELMSALQAEFSTSLSLADLRALYQWGGKLPDSAIARAAVTNQDLATDGCSTPQDYLLCPVDPTWSVMHAYFANLFPGRKVVAERAPIQLVNASRSLDSLGRSVSLTLRPLGFQMADGTQRAVPEDRTLIYDYSGGRYPLTVKWLEQYFGATLVRPAPGAAPPTPNPPAAGLAVVLGHDYALHWIGQG